MSPQAAYCAACDAEVAVEDPGDGPLQAVCQEDTGLCQATGCPLDELSAQELRQRLEFLSSPPSSDTLQRSPLKHSAQLIRSARQAGLGRAAQQARGSTE